MPEERQACLDAGVEEFLTKPIDLAALVQTLERCRALEEPLRAPEQRNLR